MPRLAARYIGASPVLLRARPGDPYLDANGAPLPSLHLSAGDTLQLEESEILGMTYLIDPLGHRAPLCLGTGVILLPTHHGRAWRDLIDERFHYAGDETVPPGTYHYEFHEGRRDFELVAPHERQFPPHPTPPSNAESRETPSSPIAPTTPPASGHTSTKE